MAIYRTGTFTLTSTAAAQTLNLGFVPSYFTMQDITLASTSGRGAEVIWDAGMAALATPITIARSVAAGSITQSTLTTTGISAFQSTDADLFTPQQAPYTTVSGNKAYILEGTNLVITGVSQAAQAVITATHSFTSSDWGVTVVSFHGIPGMTQLNNLYGTVVSSTSTTSFTVNINTTNFTAYSSSGKTAGVNTGFANVITGAPVNTLYSNQLLPTAEANLGYIGITMGTGIWALANVANSDVWSYQAWAQSPVTGP
jgi:hypothetical protein